MEEYPPSIDNEPINPTPNRLHALAFLRVGLFEFGFVAVVLMLVFGTLNYFNILSVSDVFPQQLGWLPKQTKIASQGETLQTRQPQKNFSSVSSPTPTGFQYDVKKAQTLLTQYIKDNIKPEFLPSKIEVKQHLIYDNTLTGTDYEFGANWNLKNATFSANFHYFPNNTNQIRDMEFYVNPFSFNISIDATNSVLLAKTYLKNLPEKINFDCGVFEKNTKFCEYILEKKAGKSGFGTVEGKDESGKNALFIFSCFIPRNDSYYTKRTSCLLFREKDPTKL